MTYRARTRAEIEWIKEYRARIGCSLREAAAALDAESHKPEPVDDMASLRAKLSQAEAEVERLRAEVMAPCDCPAHLERKRTGAAEERAKAAEALAAEAVAVLAGLEWFGFGFCPACNGEKPQGHYPDCRLAAVLSRARSGLGGEGGER